MIKNRIFQKFLVRSILAEIAGGTAFALPIIIGLTRTGSDLSWIFLILLFGVIIGLVSGVCFGLLFYFAHKLLRSQSHVVYELNVFMAPTLSFLNSFILHYWLFTGSGGLFDAFGH